MDKVKGKSKVMSKLIKVINEPTANGLNSTSSNCYSCRQGCCGTCERNNQNEVCSPYCWCLEDASECVCPA